MNSKISLFNKSIVKSDCKRFWWISALELLFGLMFIFVMLNSLKYIGEDPETGLRNGFLMSYMMPVQVLQFIIPVALMTLLMSYLNKGSAVSFMHSLPLGRSRLFGSHVLSALILLFTPILLICLSLSAMLAIPNFAAHVSLASIWAFGLKSMIYALFTSCATSVVCTLSGNMIFSFILTYIIAALPAVAEMLARYIISNTIYGYPETRCDVQLFLWLYKAPADASWLYFVGLTVAAAVFLLIANVILKMRSLENYGEIIAFPRLRPIFVYCVAICSGAIGYLYFATITEQRNLLYLIPFGVLGIIIANMLNKKQLTIKGAPRAMLIYTACIVLAFGFFKFDISGYERRIPQADKVSSAEVYFNSTPPAGEERHYLFDGVMYVFSEKDAFVPEISGEDIEKVLAVHSYAIKNRRSSARNSLYIKYTLKNGKTFSRRYAVSLDNDAAAEAVKPLAELNAIKAQKLPLLDGTKKDFTLMQFSDSRSGAIPPSTTDPEQMQLICDALIKDLSALSFEEYLLRPQSTVMALRVEYDKEMVCPRPLPKEYLSSDETTHFTETYVIRPSYKNTLAVLAELKLMPDLLPAEKVEEISVDYIGQIYTSVPYIESRELYSPDNQATIQYTEEKNTSYDPSVLRITDRAQLDELYGFIRNNTVTGTLDAESEGCDVTIHYADLGSVSIMYDIESLPENIRALLNVKN